MRDDTQHNELFELAVRRLSGEATPGEVKRLDEMLADEETRLVWEKLEKTWDKAELARGITRQDTEHEWQRLRAATQQKKQRSFSFLRIAASMALLATLGLVVYYFLKTDETTIMAQQLRSEELADGSSVTLNADSELRFSDDFNTEKREVSLKGEAWFEVKQNPEKPFVIHTPTLDVTVVGTSFTVNTETRKGTAEVVVSTGTVLVTFQNRSVTLEAGEKAILSKGSGQLFKVLNEDPNFLSWKTKTFTFDDVDLEEVVDLLNNAWQADLYLKDEALRNCPITVTFRNQSLEEILEVLKATLDLQIQKTKKGTSLSGVGC